MTDEPPSSYAVELRPYSDKYSHTTPGEYLEIPIPDEVEKLGVEFGDTVYMDFMSADDPAHIRISFSDTGTRHDLKLKYRDDRYPRHAVTFPTEYTVTRDDSPFQGIGRDETVTVEFNYGLEPEIRVYTEEGYRERTTKLVSDDLTPILKAPALAPLLNIFKTKPDKDLTRKTGVGGDGFEFIPFNPLDPALKRSKNRSIVDRVEKLYSNSSNIDDMNGLNIWFKNSSGPDNSTRYDFANSDTFDGSYRAILPRDERTNVLIYTEEKQSVLTLYREDETWVVEIGGDSTNKPIQMRSLSIPFQKIFVPMPVRIEEDLDFEYKLYLE